MMKRGRKKKDRKNIPLPKLNDYELLLLRNHLDSQRHQWIPLLTKLDCFFQSRTDLEWFLHDYLSIPYFTRKMLDKLLPSKKSRIHKLIQELPQDQRVVLELAKCFAQEDPKFLESLYEIVRETHNRRQRYTKEPLGTVNEDTLDEFEEESINDYEGEETIEETLKTLVKIEQWKQKRRKN